MFSATFMPEVRRWANEWVRQNIVFVSNTKPKSANARVRQNFLFLSGLEKFVFILFCTYYLQLKWTKHFREAKLVELLRGEAKNINGNAKTFVVLTMLNLFCHAQWFLFARNDRFLCFFLSNVALPATPLRPNCIGFKKARNSFANSRIIRTRNLVIQTIRMRLAISDSFYPQLVLTLNPSQVQNCR